MKSRYDESDLQDIANLPPIPGGPAAAAFGTPALGLAQMSSVMGEAQVDPNSQKGAQNLSKNPSVRGGSVLPNGRKRIPMSVPRRQLETPELPGYHLHWFKERNVAWATQGGYEFVDSGELSVVQKNVGGDSESSGNQDMGSRIRVMSAITEGADPQYFVLMKIRQEWFEEDQRALASRNLEILRAIFRDKRILGPQGMSQSDSENRYVSKALFSRPLPKDLG